MGSNFGFQLKNSPHLKFVINKSEINPPDEIRGTVTLTVDKPIQFLDIIIVLNRLEAYKNPDFSKMKTTEIKRIYLKAAKTLNQKTENIYLKPGSYTFNYTFLIPEKIEPNFDFHSSNTRIIGRNIIRAQVLFGEFQDEEEIACEKNLMVTSKLKIKDHKELFCTSEKLTSMLFDQGICTCFGFLCKINFKFNDIIPITIKVDNSKGKLTANLLNIKVMRKILYKDENDSNKIIGNQEFVYNKIKKSIKIGPGKIGVFKLEIPIKDESKLFYSFKGIPEIYHQKDMDWNTVLPTFTGTLFDAIYQIKIEVIFNTNVSKTPKLFIPIILTHEATNLSKFEEPFDKVENVNNNNDNSYNSNNNIKKNNNLIHDDLLNNYPEN